MWEPQSSITSPLFREVVMVSYQPSVSERQAIPNSLSLGSCQLSVTWSGTDWWIYWRLLLTKENLKWLGLSIAQSPQKLLNLLQTNFKAASGTVEMLTDLLADLESLPSLITLSGEPWCLRGSDGGSVDTDPQECGQTWTVSLAHRESSMQASFALALGQAIRVHNPEGGMFNAQPQRPPSLGTKQ